MVQFYSPKKKKEQKPQDIQLTIEGLDAFGQGIAKAKRKTYFISGALPGEVVIARITDDKRQFAKGDAFKLLKQSALRQAPTCRHYPLCGGCQQQHVKIELQQQSKLDALLHLLSQGDSAELERLSARASVLATTPYGYRRRVKLGLQYLPKQQQLVMGFREKSSNTLVDITMCPVSVESIASLLVPLRQLLANLSIVRRLGHVEIVAADNTTVVLLRHLAPLSAQDSAVITAFAEKHHVTFYLQGNNAEPALLCGQPPYYCLDGLTFHFEPGGFIQVNGEVNQQMVAQALAWLDLHATDHVLDLFCGIGNFTLPIAQRTASVIGIEGVRQSVEMATRNAQSNQIDNVQFFHANLDGDVKAHSWSHQPVDKVLLDPARAGALETMNWLIALSPLSIVYVSCNPATLARDCQILREHGYLIEKVCMLDMFPNTQHLESMVLLTKKKDGKPR